MGKYTKMALVLLYLLQLVIVFRDQLAHMYRSAVESVHREADQAAMPRAENGLRAVFERVARIGRPGMHATMAAAASVATASAGAILTGSTDSEGTEPHHNDDDRKDKARKHRHRLIAEYVLCNLWPRIRRSPAAPSAITERAADIIRVMLFADAGAKTPAA